jgi:hypothetical protein
MDTDTEAALARLKRIVGKGAVVENPGPLWKTVKAAVVAAPLMLVNLPLAFAGQQAGVDAVNAWIATSHHRVVVSDVMSYMDQGTRQKQIAFEGINDNPALSVPAEYTGTGKCEVVYDSTASFGTTMNVAAGGSDIGTLFGAAELGEDDAFLFVLLHETGHCLGGSVTLPDVKSALAGSGIDVSLSELAHPQGKKMERIISQARPYVVQHNERTADSFAALMWLKMGRDPEFLRQWMARRVLTTMAGEVLNHDTSSSLAAILARAEDADFMVKLRAANVDDVAAMAYGNAHATMPEMSLASGADRFEQFEVINDLLNGRLYDLPASVSRHPDQFRSTMREVIAALRAATPQSQVQAVLRMVSAFDKLESVELERSSPSQIAAFLCDALAYGVPESVERDGQKLVAQRGDERIKVTQNGERLRYDGSGHIVTTEDGKPLIEYFFKVKVAEAPSVPIWNAVQGR